MGVQLYSIIPHSQGETVWPQLGNSMGLTFAHWVILIDQQVVLMR